MSQEKPSGHLVIRGVEWLCVSMRKYQFSDSNNGERLTEILEEVRPCQKPLLVLPRQAKKCRAPPRSKGESRKRNNPTD